MRVATECVCVVEEVSAFDVARGQIEGLLERVARRLGLGGATMELASRLEALDSPANRSPPSPSASAHR